MKLFRNPAAALIALGLAAAPLVAQPAKPAAPAAPAATPAPAQPALEKVDPAKLPAVVAKLAGGQVTKEQLLDAVETRRQGLERMGVQVPADSKLFYTQVLDTLLAAQLLAAESATLGYTPSEADVDKEIAAIKQGFEGDAAFKQALEQQGMTEAMLRSEIKEDLAIKKLMAEKLAPKVAVDDAAMHAFYDENKARMQEPEKFLASHILIQAKASDTAEVKAAARKKAEGLQTQIKSGGDFAKLAKESSDDPGSKDAGGALPWLGRGQTVPPFEQAALALKPGEVSGVVESPFGFHIIKLVDRKDARQVPFDEAKPKIEEYLKQQGLKAELDKHVKELRAKGGVQVFI